MRFRKYFYFFIYSLFFIIVFIFLFFGSECNMRGSIGGRMLVLDLSRRKTMFARDGSEAVRWDRLLVPEFGDRGGWYDG